jgi:flagellar hook-associated protein 3 FlgL
MPVNPTNFSRVSNLMRGNMVSASITRQQKALSEIQQQLTTGKRLATPSDDAGDAAVAQQLRKLLEQREAYTANLSAANSQLSEVDSTLADVNDLVREAQQVASQNVGSDVTPEERSAAAEIIDALFNQILTLANKSFGGTFLFAGDRATEQPFTDESGGVKWVGSSRLLANRVDEATDLQFQIDGAQIFGALSTRVRGSVDATPALTADTRLVDLAGTNEKGIRPGFVRLSDGSTSVELDLSRADTLGDVVDQLNAAGMDVTASLNAAGFGIELTVGAGVELTLNDVGGGTMADDLGIRRAVSAGAGVGLSGGSTQPRITPLTSLASLNAGAGIDTSGFTITNGVTTRVVDLSSATNVEDMLNAINNAGVGVRAQINAAGNGIDILNGIQGTPMIIAEAGGTTAADLGLRSFDPATKLTELNDYEGVTLVDGAEFRVTDSAGVAFDVDVDSAGSIQDLIDTINNQATTAGAGVTASFSAGTNNLVLTDTAGGPGTLAIGNLNGSDAIEELGLDGPVVGTTLDGRDVNPINSTGMFASLIRLRNAMRSNDQREITRAAEILNESESNLIRVRGEVGAKVQEFEARVDRIEDQNIATRGLLSEMEDTDFTEAIVKFQTLQTSLQASLQSASSTLNLSLMDYL